MYKKSKDNIGIFNIIISKFKYNKKKILVILFKLIKS